MITLRTKPEDRVIELGGGGNPLIRPNVDVRMCHDQNGNPTVDFTANFEEPLPIQSEEWDGVLMRYSYEHISWRKIPLFTSELFRITKPGGKVVLIVPNTEAQIRYILEHPDGWDGKDEFTSASCILFGDLDYGENSHKAYLSPRVITKLLQDAGFTKVLIQPYGAISTDMLVEAVKPVKVESNGQVISNLSTLARESNPQPESQNVPEPLIPFNPADYKPKDLYGYDYFNGGRKLGGYAAQGYWDFPSHVLTANHVLVRQPKSVLELGCGRCYVLKRLEDNGIKCQGLEVSKHCYMTRASDGVVLGDVTKTPWVFGKQEFDLCFSQNLLQHIPEYFIPHLAHEMERTCKRGLHGIEFGDSYDGFDKTVCTLRPRSWWLRMLPEGHEILDKRELEQGEFPKEVLEGDGRLKLNLGSFTTQWHYGWINIDLHDLNGFAQANGYKYRQWDVTQGIPYATGVVDCAVAVHMLEHLTYAQGITLLRELRRVIRQDGVIRLTVPDAAFLMHMYVFGETNPIKEERHKLVQFDEISPTCEAQKTSAGKLWEILHAEHQAIYDESTLLSVLEETGWQAMRVGFRESGFRDRAGSKQILVETLDTLPCLSLYVEAIPKI